MPAAAAEPQIMSLATAVPEHAFDQSAVAEVAGRMFGKRYRDFGRLSTVFANSGIATRYSVCPLEWFTEPATPHGWPERSAAFLAGAADLFGRAAKSALEQAGLAAHEIDTIVTVCSTGIATPTIETHQLSAMGFRADVKRVPVFGLGCAGGASGLSLAARLARAEPREHVLLVVLETCTLAFREDEFTKSNMVAIALFGDGAAAAVICGDASGGLAGVEHHGEHTWPDTLDIMGWRIDPTGFGAIFSKSIPDLVRDKLSAAAHAFLARQGLGRDDLDGFVFHPGGAKVVDALEAAFELPQGELNKEREVLRSFGNMSAPTVLFVLQQALTNGLSGRTLLSALGPGFSASFLTLKAA